MLAGKTSLMFHALPVDTTAVSGVSSRQLPGTLVFCTSG